LFATVRVFLLLLPPANDLNAIRRDLLYAPLGRRELAMLVIRHPNQKNPVRFCKARMGEPHHIFTPAGKQTTRLKIVSLDRMNAYHQKKDTKEASPQSLAFQIFQVLTCLLVVLQFTWREDLFQLAIAI
jgi:hypothetical protein